MVFHREINRRTHGVKNKVFVAVSTLGLVLSAGGLSLTMAGSASATTLTTLSGCVFAESGSVWTLQSNCNSTQEIVVPAGVTLDGDDYTISSAFSKSDNSNNAVVGVLTNNVTIQNLTIEGRNGTNDPIDAGLHGIMVYNSTGVTIDEVTVKNMNRTGIVVNSSVVSVSKVTTINNGWHGINVDKKTSQAAILNIVGPMTQTDLYQIYVDDITKRVTVNDFLHQYSVSHPGTNDALYTRIYATDKQSCKDDGWKLGLSATQSFKNQGQCVSHFESGDGKSSVNEED
jgi:hypothetical protein